jgi:hypothetical protein
MGGRPCIAYLVDVPVRRRLVAGVGDRHGAPPGAEGLQALHHALAKCLLPHQRGPPVLLHSSRIRENCSDEW